MRKGWSRRRRDVRGFTVGELLVVAAILAALAALITPVVAQARQAAAGASCAATLRQLGTAASLYAQDYDGLYPAPFQAPCGATWDAALRPYVRGQGAWRCAACVVPPALASEPVQGYAINQLLGGGRFAAASTPRFFASTVLFCEGHFTESVAPNGATIVTAPVASDAPAVGAVPGEAVVGTPAAVRHRGGSNYVFFDGHVRWYRPGRVRPATQGNDGYGPSFGF